MKYTLSISLTCLIIFCQALASNAQRSLIDVDKELLYQVPKPLVKNKSLTVISDRSFQESGLELYEIGFRKDSYSGKIELLIQFKGDAGYKTDIGIHLFGEDRQTMWVDSMKRTDQPQQYNLIPMIVRPSIQELTANAVLYIWARTPVKKIPYEMWEWMDIGTSDWIVPASDSLIDLNSLEKDTTRIYRENNIANKPVFNHEGQTALEYIQNNVTYPEEARTNQVEGIVMVTFVVSADGVVQDAVLGFNIGSGCGQEVLRVVQSMPSWQPGEVDGKRVPVRVTRPVKFVLSE